MHPKNLSQLIEINTEYLWWHKCNAKIFYRFNPLQGFTWEWQGGKLAFMLWSNYNTVRLFIVKLETQVFGIMCTNIKQLLQSRDWCRQYRPAAQRRLVRWTRYQYPTMNENMSLPGTPSACRDRDPQKVLKNWPRLDEWGTTQFHYHRIPNDSPTSKTQTTDFLSSAITLPDSPRDKGSKNWWWRIYHSKLMPN